MPAAKLVDRLNEKIDQYQLSAARDLIHAHSKDCIAVRSAGSDDYSQVGKSRFGGDPDLPGDFD